MRIATIPLGERDCKWHIAFHAASGIVMHVWTVSLSISSWWKLAKGEVVLTI
ncbi:hypothetical protein [Rubritalea tangerina]|uniref:hypothetical protein n=1 Tax=Rubritalea tangerina TaxID=430798 RepID=UPI00360B52A3